MSSNHKPAAELRIGAIKATIWENQGENRVRYNTVFSRLYRDGDQWKTTNHFGFRDLLTLAKLADQAHTLITERSAETSQSEAGGNGETAQTETGGNGEDA